MQQCKSIFNFRTGLNFECKTSPESLKIRGRISATSWYFEKIGLLNVRERSPKMQVKEEDIQNLGKGQHEVKEGGSWNDIT